MTAADAGHLVIGTMSTLNAHKTVERIIDSYPEDEQNQILTMLADSLMAVVAQQLLVTSDGKGRMRYEILLRHSREAGVQLLLYMDSRLAGMTRHGMHLRIKEARIQRRFFTQ